MHHRYKIPVSSISCVSCTSAITNKLSQHSSLKKLQVTINHDKPGTGGFVEFELDSTSEFTLENVLALIEAMGHRVSRKKIKQHQTKNSQNEHLIKALLCAALGLPLMLLSALGISLPISAMAAVATLSLAAMLYSGKDIYQKGILEATKTGTITMDTLFTISTFVAFSLSFAAFFIPGLAFEFETALLIFSSRHLGKYLESKMQQRISNKLDCLSRLPKNVLQIVQYQIAGLQQTKVVKTKALRPGDIIQLMPGEYIPADGELLSKHSQVYKTLISGNLLPEAISQGEKLLAGMKVADTPLYMRVKKSLADSYLTKYNRSLNRTKKQETQMEVFSNKVIQYFIPGIVITTAITMAITIPVWGINIGLHSAMALLVGACPCTLGFIIPLAMRVGLDRSAQHGALIKNAKAIEQATHIDKIIFDLNGTLTQGKPVVSGMKLYANVCPHRVLQLVHHLEDKYGQQHSIALALKQYAQSQLSMIKTLEDPIQNQNLNGQPGIQASIAGKHYALGNANLMQTLGISLEQKAQRIYLSEDHQVIAHFDIHDPIHPQAQTVINALKNQGLEVILCTGADSATANFYATQLDISTVKANCHGGKAKRDYLKSLQGHITMVGDAINDALAMKQALIGIAMNQADPISKKVADVVIQHDDLLPISHFFSNAQDTMNTVKQNLLISLFYNLSVMSLTTLVVLNLGAIAPSAMALSMAVQSLFVLANTYILKKAPISTPMPQQKLQYTGSKQHNLNENSTSPQRQKQAVSNYQTKPVSAPEQPKPMSCCSQTNSQQTELDRPPLTL